ncbi:MAG TPA: hypothetical protein VHP14_15315 [Anaerolineales bacterium]|nr:hypothetical protein [Anaerolineales bacterium]
MLPEYDEKGKIFTPVITKKPVAVTIQTVSNQIHGCIHTRLDERIKDALKEDDNFLAVTDAIVYDQQRQVLYRTQFLAVNTALIVYIIPDDDLLDSPQDQS